MRLYRPGNVVANRYEVQEVLGIGPVAATYTAREQESQELLALKVINAELTISEAERESWVESMRVVSEARHPHLRDLYEVESQGALVFYTGHYHPGGSLRALLRAHPVLRFTEAEPLLSQICQALREVELCHGGLRPENILLSAGAVRVSDLGLGAALPKGAYWGALRQEPARVYLAPELLQGGEATRSSDLFALGVILAELLTGQTPPATESLSLAKRLRLHESLDELLQRTLSPSPAARYQDVEEFARDLRQVSRLTVFFPRSSSLDKAALLQKLKNPEAASVPEPTPKPQLALKPPARPAEPAKVSAPAAKLPEPPKPAEPASKLNLPAKPAEGARPIDRLSSPSISLRGVNPEPVIQRPAEAKPAAKTTELPKPIGKPPEASRSSESLSKVGILIRPEPPKIGAPGSMRFSTGEQELVKPRPPESLSKVGIVLKPEPPRPAEPASKIGIPVKAPAPEAPKSDRLPATPAARANDQDATRSATPEPKLPKPAPTSKLPPAEHADPEPTQVSAKIPEAFAALIAAENAADARANNGGFDPALMLLRPFDSSQRSPEPYLLNKTTPISRSMLPEPPKAAEPTLSTRLGEAPVEAPKAPEPTSVFLKSPEPLKSNDPAFVETKMNKLPKALVPEYPAIDSIDLFVDVEELEIEEEPLNPFAEDPKKPKTTNKPLWPRLDSEDGETTGIRPLPSRRTPSLSLQDSDPFDDLFTLDPPKLPPFEPDEK